MDVFKKLYDEIADRKSKPSDFMPYDGNNGRVNNALDLYRSKQMNCGLRHLDVGGGIGDLSSTLRKEGIFEQVYMVDLAEKNLEAAREKGVNVIQCHVDLQGLPFHDGIFTSVSALDFIEHIVNPEKFARECFRVLEPGGDVLINTPNIRFWRHIEELIRWGRFPHTSGDTEVFHGGHVAFYTYGDLQEIFRSAGFSSNSVRFDDPNFEMPPEMFVSQRPGAVSYNRVINQSHYRELLLEFGAPNVIARFCK